MPRHVVITDLDGTLLDQETYAFEAARPALSLLAERQIPLILCSSKTRPELEHYRPLLQNNHPFIAENGGALFLPQGYFPSGGGGTVREAYEVIELGLPYARLVRALKQCRRETGASLTGFHELSPEEVAQLTGLPLPEARLAKAREYDEPFLLHRAEEGPVVEEWASRGGFRISRGGRLLHLTGPSDKGRAVRLLLSLFRREGECQAVGLGDSANDLPMLREVDLPFAVQRPDGTYDPALTDPRIVRVAGVGPAGWNRALLGLLSGARREVQDARRKPEVS